MVWYSHLFQNFPRFIVIHSVKGFGIVNKAEMQFVSCFSFSGGSPHISSAHLWGRFVFPTKTTLFPMDVLRFTLHLSVWDSKLGSLRVSFILPAAAAKSLQLCLTLCDPIDGSPPGSAVPGILQARTLEWVAISFSNA